jgi:hypothetical protein
VAETLESRPADDETAVIAAERIRSGAVDHKEDGAEARAKLAVRPTVAGSDSTSLSHPVPACKSTAALGSVPRVANDRKGLFCHPPPARTG